jgi:sugar phosphate isomerase/epimerase
MTVQLSKKQIEALKVELAQYGLKITVARSAGASLNSWKPETPAGRKCKSSMIKWARLAKTNPIVGVTSYMVRDHFGEWLKEGHPRFAEAVAYRKQIEADFAPQAGEMITPDAIRPQRY